jgi:hypothetical protein
MRRSWALALGVGMLALAGAAHGGQFFVTTVWYSFYPPYSQSVRGWVAANARYQGTVDGNDNHVLLQTTACERPEGGIEICDGGTNFGINVNGPFFTNQVVTCNTTACMGNRFASRPCCDVQTNTFRGKGGAAIYHQFSPDIDTLWGFPTDVLCKECDLGGPPCGESSSAEMVVLPIFEEPGVILREAPSLPAEFVFPSRSMIDGRRYVMDQWALLSAMPGEPRLRLAMASSPELEAALRRDDPGEAPPPPFYSGAGAAAMALAVVAPVHPANERWIPTPEPRLDYARVEHGGRGRLAIRALFGEDRSLKVLNVLYQEGSIVPETIAALRDDLTLHYFSERSHVAVVYAVIEVRESMEILRSVTVLPRCCGEGPPFPVSLVPRSSR